jgi:hypothetical protein
MIRSCLKESSGFLYSILLASNRDQTTEKRIFLELSHRLEFEPEKSPYRNFHLHESNASPRYPTRLFSCLPDFLIH